MVFGTTLSEVFSRRLATPLNPHALAAADAARLLSTVGGEAGTVELLGVDVPAGGAASLFWGPAGGGSAATASCVDQPRCQRDPHEAG